MANGLCSWECSGYNEAPPVGDLWPGEKRIDFDFPKACPVCELPTELLGIPDPAKAIEAAREAMRLAHNAAIGHDNSALKAKIRAALAMLEGKKP
jgi:hypothetical protein